ncbi:ATP-binding protein [Cupriavidus metallidurans]|uniref:histidine kinase n=1 Tax=Cupriavidus metallidurans (strain ATCC 43123 / DSM 2839 / NBRC 102507 / CH34) TaxID=266264 RepID=Q1LLZ9_CUPMC|nr:ATP-binding protein [Cupriavidus metallidurans]ABF08827.1 sensory histidine kinase in two-component regulatory system [Cupriavidus metallidurans CH34]AVA36067.1 HAMP domain-containing protein [Cupriavidus metallidurans]MDE4918217.1 ATP-binding protein [Cupriavidus metallidurans]QGS30260.1 HAMP domain-containing protein [Cupriavidus metallidurans]UBM09700.1 HAMP domain-containing protein [Cupriavidus metallidurans]
MATALGRTATRFFGSLFWRTFMLIALLLAISLGIWFQSYRLFERAPRAQQIAMQVVSVVKLTRAALLYSDPARRRFLLLDLVQNEGIKVYPREKDDDFAAPTANPFLTQLVQQEIRGRLGEDTVIATTVNDIPGVWVSFEIEGDDYWVAISPERFERVPGIQWLWWSIAALMLSIIGAAFITARVNYPLKRLANAARQIGSGGDPPPLREQGASEVAQANRSFNQMVHDLRQLDDDRVVMLAGISHDLRTPLTRLRLETEMSPVDNVTRDAMIADIEQMDAIIGQFLNYARPGQEVVEPVDLSTLVQESVGVYAAHDDVRIHVRSNGPVMAMANRMEIQRILDNLVENARRYAKDEETGMAEVEISTRVEDKDALLVVADNGMGVPDEELSLLTRPFYRLDAARSEAKGAGLGMSIVNRILQRNGGRLVLANRPAPKSGLVVSAIFRRA